MPKVELIDFTGKGREDEEVYAANVLLFAKSTRLGLEPERMWQLADLDDETRAAELESMVQTIRSSWEFVDVTFLISGVSRAAAQQITRTRTGSYAMQSQRAVDVSGVKFVNPYEPGQPLHYVFNRVVDDASYRHLLAVGAHPQDARGALPIAVECNLLAKYNLRSFVDLITSRSSRRTQGEYAAVAKLMKMAVLDVWPWSAPFFRPPNEVALELLDEVAERLGSRPGDELGWKVAKAMDLIRGVHE